jgi:hypothetical protein
MSDLRRVTFVDYQELQQLVGQFLGKPGYETLVPDMESSGWHNDMDVVFQIDKRAKWVQPNHDNHISEVRQRGYPKWNWEILSIMEELVERKMLPRTGLYDIEISW